MEGAQLYAFFTVILSPPGVCGVIVCCHYPVIALSGKNLL
jgi:hypothetical protein